MQRTLFSPAWHSVADLKPRLAPQVNLSRHVYRGRVWFVLHDLAGGRTHRITPAAHALLCRFDGQRSVDEIWRESNQTEAQDTFTQSDVIDLLIKLHGADILITDTTPDAAALFNRHRKKRRQPLIQWLKNPMSLRVPLWNPDPLLTRLLPLYRPLFSRLGLCIYLALLLPAIALFIRHAPDFTHNLADTALSAGNLALLALVFPLVKFLHEMAHGMAAKVWGGAVPQMGLMFMVFAPVPYVDASSANAFPSKAKRATVAAAGMMMELFLAAVAVWLWVLVEPGLVRAVCFNVVLVTGISTLIINGNPLLKYDGYYILTDLIEMPNLAQRGQKYWTWLCDRHLFRAPGLIAPDEQPAERRWLLYYTPAAWVYRCFVTVTIILFVAEQYFILGTLLALWGAVTLIVLPLLHAGKHITTAATLQRVRGRTLRVTALIAAGAAIFLLWVPLPVRTVAQGVVWLPDDAILRAGEAGFLETWRTPPGQPVNPGTPLFKLQDAQARADLNRARAREEEARLKFQQEQFDAPAKAEVSRQAWLGERATLERAEQKHTLMTGVAATSGVWITDAAEDKPGRYYKKGEIIGYVLEPANLLARVIITQDDVGLLRGGLTRVTLRPAGSPGRSLESGLLREYPGGTTELPSPALAAVHGGDIPTAPDDTTGQKSLNRVFAYDFVIPPHARDLRFGERIHVRLEHGYEPLAMQGLRRLRQLFLSRFRV